MYLCIQPFKIPPLFSTSIIDIFHIGQLLANSAKTIRKQIKKALNPTKGREASTRGTTLLVAQKLLYYLFQAR